MNVSDKGKCEEFPTTYCRLGHILSVYNNYTKYKTNSGDWHMDLLSTDKILNCVAYFLVRYNI